MKIIKMKKPNEMTLANGCEEYLIDCKARNLRAGTIKHWNEATHNILIYFNGEMLISELNKDTMKQFVLVLQEKNLHDMSIYAYTRDLRTLMYFFMRMGWLNEFRIATPKVTRPSIETYTDKELALLLKKPNVNKCSFSEFKAWTIVNFLLSTGVRANSLANIQIKDVDFDNNVVYVNVTKNRKPLIVPMNNSIVKILHEYLRIRGGEVEDYLFCNVYGKKLTKSTMYHTIYTYNKSRGVEQTGMHRFRHTFAKKSILNGMNVVTLSKILGHSSLNITQQYLNLLVTDYSQDIIDADILKEFNNITIKNTLTHF